MHQLPTPAENPHGLHAKYNVTHTDGSPVDPDAVYFVLRIDTKQKDLAHQIACRQAARTYIRAVRQSIVSDHLLKMVDELESLIDEI